MNSKNFVSILLSIFLFSMCTFALLIQPIANGTDEMLTNQTSLPDINEVDNNAGNITLLAQQQIATELPEMDEIDPRHMFNITDVINKLAVEEDRHRTSVFNLGIQSNTTHPQGHVSVIKKPKKDLSLPKDKKNKKNIKNISKTNAQKSKIDKAPVDLSEIVFTPRVYHIGDVEHKYHVYRKRTNINLYDQIKNNQAKGKSFDSPHITLFREKLKKENIQIYDNTDIFIQGYGMLLVFKNKSPKIVYLSDKDSAVSQDRFSEVNKFCNMRKLKKDAEAKKCCYEHAMVSEISITFPGLISYEVFKTIKNECPNSADKTLVRNLMDKTVDNEYGGYRIIHH